jgi:hypothetical protein
MDPHDQQDWVSSGADFAVIVVKDELVIAAYFPVPLSIARFKPRALMCWARTVAPQTFAGVGARATQARNQAENDVPQPHDFVAWGFTKTNPCCISVS